jgi:hypothetical protein
MSLIDGHNPNALPEPEKVRRDVMGLGQIETVCLMLPHGGEIWASKKPGGLTEKAVSLQGNVMLLCFQGHDKHKVAQALGIKLPEGV